MIAPAARRRQRPRPCAARPALASPARPLYLGPVTLHAAPLTRQAAETIPAPARAPGAARLAGALWTLLVWAGGMLVAFRPMLLSRLARMQTDWGDTRLNNYILEHGWRWLAGVPGHERFWSPPVFYPAPNTFAYSDVLLGVAPPYWALRALGVAPDTAFQLWMLVMATLNYVVAALFLRRVARASVGAAAVGGAVFAFAGPRVAQIVHAQLLPQFYTVIAVWALARMFDRPTTSGGSASPGGRWWIALFFAAAVAQLYAAFYYGWLLGFALLIALAWGCASAATRRPLTELVRRERWAILLSAAIAAIALLPIAIPYLMAARQLPPRPFSLALVYLPRPQSWVFMGRESLAYGWLANRPAFLALPMGQEQRLGLGVVTTIVVVAGLWRGRDRALVRLLGLVSLTLVACATLWPGGVTAWRIVFAVVPGASALRAVARIGLMLLLPAAVGAALLIDALAVRGAARALLVACITFVIGAEQWQFLLSYDKYDGRARVADVARRIPAGCEAFLYTPLDGREDPWWYQMDGIWASAERGVPTLNGYSGNRPPGWQLYDIVVRTPVHERALEHAVADWAARWHLDVHRLCMVRNRPSD